MARKLKKQPKRTKLTREDVSKLELHLWANVTAKPAK